MNNTDFHEVWWIYAPERHPWGGLRIATFRKTIDGTLIFFISHEPRDRMGPRIWDEVSPREGWTRVKQIPFPVRAEIDAAVYDAIATIAQDIKIKAGFDS